MTLFMKKTRLRNDKIKIDRINKIIDMLVRGKKRGEIVVLLSEEWNCSYTWVDKYIKFAKLEIKKQFDGEQVEDVHSQFQFLYERAILNKNDKLAKEILIEKRKLKDNVQRVDITSGGISLKDLFKFE